MNAIIDPYQNIRWLIRRDMPDVLRIEAASFPSPWSEEDFMNVLRHRNCIGMVAEYKDDVVGFMIYELHKSRLNILNFCVDPGFCRMGVGSAMIDRMKNKLSQQGRSELQVEVREGNLTAQQFFRHQGFRAISVLREHYDDTDEDCYLFRYRVPVEMGA